MADPDTAGTTSMMNGREISRSGGRASLQLAAIERNQPDTHSWSVRYDRAKLLVEPLERHARQKLGNLPQ